ncbi:MULTISPECIES: acyl carrier protein [unclassified Thiocapsa]|uniref:acyl carrier protein n=1 Tax=unclassified Thiocapsa TaxID=2641286 RepID=UPI0035AF12F4
MFDEIEETLREIIAKSLKVDKDLIQKNSSLDDWGGDSLDFIETLFAIETRFDISLPDVGGGRDLNLEKLADMIREQISKRS